MRVQDRESPAPRDMEPGVRVDLQTLYVFGAIAVEILQCLAERSPAELAKSLDARFRPRKQVELAFEHPWLLLQGWIWIRVALPFGLAPEQQSLDLGVGCLRVGKRVMPERNGKNGTDL